MRKYKLFALSLCALTLCACGPKNPTPASEPEVDNTVSVFVLSGQSNMEGNTHYVHPRTNEELLKENQFYGRGHNLYAA